MNAEWAKFPGRLRAFVSETHGEPCYFSAYDALRHVGISPHKRLLTSFRAFYRDSAATEGTVRYLVPNSALDKGTFHHPPFNARKYTTTPCFQWVELQQFLCFVLRRSQKTSADIHKSLQDFSIPSSNFNSAFVGSAEKDTLASLRKALPYRMHEQFRVGEYRIDAYFPDLRIALGCDEHDHKAYDRAAEAARRVFIEQTLNCVYLTYDPFHLAYDVLDVVNMILSTMASPMYQTFMARTAVYIVPPMSRKLYGQDQDTEIYDSETTSAEEDDETKSVPPSSSSCAQKSKPAAAAKAPAAGKNH